MSNEVDMNECHQQSVLLRLTFFSLRIVVSQYVSARIGPVDLRNGKWTAIALKTGPISGAFVGGLAQATETGCVEIRHEGCKH
jgi:hypothetical protein